jgi:hypothetical protein
VWFGIGFILGRPLSYRLSLEVAAWSGLIAIPTHILTGILAWTRETMRGVHAGFGILLPDSETPNRFMIGLGIFLDALGPLSIWYVVVLVLGARRCREPPESRSRGCSGACISSCSCSLPHSRRCSRPRRDRATFRRAHRRT